MSNPLTTAEIYVKNANQTYTTNRVRGLSSSCTSGPEQAARLQAQKLFGPSLISVELKSPDHVYTQLYLVTADAPQIAYCWANGVIEFGDTLPDGALQIASGPSRALQEIVTVKARKSWKEGVWLVPGVPEAQQDDEAVDALLQWLGWCGPRVNASKENYGVQFAIRPGRPAAPARKAA